MYTFVDFTSQIAGRRGSLVPQTRGSHTPIWCAGLAVTLKTDYYYYYYYIFKRKHVECQTRCKIYETCMFVILPIYEMPSKFHIIHHSMNLT
jgi:hypothetical protein